MISQELERANETINQLRRENEQSKIYIQQYEEQIRDMEAAAEAIEQSTRVMND